MVSYADDLGHCSEVQSLATSVDVMAFYEEKMRLVIITRSLFLSQLQVRGGRVRRLVYYMVVFAQVGCGSVVGFWEVTTL